MCSHKYRCVQCVQSHEPGLCPRLINKNLPLGCVNCAAAEMPHAGHTANDYKSCLYYAKINNQTAVGDDKKKSADQKATTRNGSAARFQLNNIEEPILANNPWTTGNGKTGKKTRKFIQSQKPAETHPNHVDKTNFKNNSNQNDKQNGKSPDPHVNSNKGVDSLVNALLEVLARFR